MSETFFCTKDGQKLSKACMSTFLSNLLCKIGNATSDSRGIHIPAAKKKKNERHLVWKHEGVNLHLVGVKER